MIQCLDIHTHHPAPQPYGVVSSTIDDFTPMEGQFYSIGVHPWATEKLPTSEEWALFDQMASLPCVVAIGECGVDKFKGGPLYRQEIIFKRQIDLSERLGKPLIIHDVKLHDVLVGYKRELPITQKWMIHGFRGKPTVAKMMTDAGIYLSFGEKFNAESLLKVPEHMILAETDESILSIQEIIDRLSETKGKDMTRLIAGNTKEFLGLDH